MAGRLLGIARKPRTGAPPETLDGARVTIGHGIEGDHRGRLKPGSRNRRQVTAMSLEDWQAAIADVGPNALRWSDRRVNLLVDGIDLPREPGARLRVGGALFEITGECDPCSRMDGVLPGLRAALIPGWRGGRLMRVLGEGAIAVGDAVTVEAMLAEAV